MLPVQRDYKFLEGNDYASISLVTIVFLVSCAQIHPQFVYRMGSPNARWSMGQMEATNDRKLLCETNQPSNVIRELGPFSLFKNMIRISFAADLLN